MAILSARTSFCGAVAFGLIGLTVHMASANSPLPALEQFNEAERLFWLDNWIKARSLYAECEFRLAASDPEKSLISKFSRLRADAETKLSYYTVSKTIAADLDGPKTRLYPRARLRGLMVKATADLSINDPTLSGQEWKEVQRLAHSLKEDGWENRANGELGIIAYLRGETGRAVALNTESFLKAKSINDTAGMVRALSLKGVGLIERKAPDQALTYFDQALALVQANPDVRFPLMAYMGKSTALEAQGDISGSGALLQKVNQFVETTGMSVYKADLAIALGVQAEARGRLKEADAQFERAQKAAALAHMPRPFADALFHKIEVRNRQSDWKGAEQLLPEALKADRELIDIQYLPRHLAQAADIEVHVGNIVRAREYLSQASDLIEAALAKAQSAGIERSLISTMNDVFVAQFELALNQDGNLPRAFEIVENARSRVLVSQLRAAYRDLAVDTQRLATIEKQIASIQLDLISSAHTADERRKSLAILGEAEAERDAIQLNTNQHSRLSGPRPLPLATIQQSLSPDELLLEYVLGDKESFALAITKDTSKVYRLPSADVLDKLVSHYT